MSDPVASFFRQLQNLPLTEDKALASLRETLRTRIAEGALRNQESSRLYQRMDSPHLSRSIMTSEEEHALFGRILMEGRQRIVDKRYLRASGIFGFAHGIHLARFSAAAVTLFVTGGIAVGAAAESAVPGDFLYPVKIEITEPLLSVVRISASDKAEWEIERAQRRLREAIVLDNNGSIDDEADSLLADSLLEHIERAETLATNIAITSGKDDALKIHAGLESALKVHENIVDADSVRVLEAVHRKRQIAQNERIRYEQELINEPDETVLDEAEENAGTLKESIAKLREELNRKTDSLDEEVQASLETQLAITEKILIESEDQAEAGNADEAFLSVQTGLRLAEETEVMLDLQEILADEDMPGELPATGSGTQ